MLYVTYIYNIQIVIIRIVKINSQLFLFKINCLAYGEILLAINQFCVVKHIFYSLFCRYKENNKNGVILQ